MARSKSFTASSGWPKSMRRVATVVVDGGALRRDLDRLIEVVDGLPWSASAPFGDAAIAVDAGFDEVGNFRIGQSLVIGGERLVILAAEQRRRSLAARSSVTSSALPARPVATTRTRARPTSVKRRLVMSPWREKRAAASPSDSHVPHKVALCQHRVMWLCIRFALPAFSSPQSGSAGSVMRLCQGPPARPAPSARRTAGDVRASRGFASSRRTAGSIAERVDPRRSGQVRRVAPHGHASTPRRIPSRRQPSSGPAGRGPFRKERLRSRPWQARDSTWH